MQCSRCPREAEVEALGFHFCDFCSFDVRQVLLAVCEKGRPRLQARLPPGQRWAQVSALLDAEGFITIRMLERHAGMTNVHAKDYLHQKAKRGHLEQIGPGKFKRAEGEQHAGAKHLLPAKAGSRQSASGDVVLAS